MSELRKQLMGAALVGVAAHWGHFVHGEHDLKAANVARIHVVAAILIACLKCRYQHATARQALIECLALDAAYAIALFSSVVVFRLFLSPLRRIPGPFRLRWTKLTHLWAIMSGRRNCKILHDLHLEYGDVVRTGPSEVTVFGLDAYKRVHGPESRCLPAAFYDIIQPLESLNTIRDNNVHAHRRKTWDRAFSFRSLEGAEPIVYSRAAELVKQLHMRVGESLDISKWLEYYTFDTMGLFGLGIDFKNLTEGEHRLVGLYRIAYSLLGPLAAVPWLRHLMASIPFNERMSRYTEFMSWANTELETMIRNGGEKRQNIIGHVINDAETSGGVDANRRSVVGDIELVIAAGSDTVHQVLVNVTYYLVRYPDHLARVREELASIDVRDYKALQHVPHLNAVICETLRLNPAIPSAGLRLPPRGGMSINGVYIPEHTTIATPQYSLMRDKRYFERPEEWIPERFSTEPKLVLDRDAFVPWSIGKRSCVGKNLSLMEVKVAVALVFSELDFGFAPGQDGTSMFTRATDYFTATPGPLELTVKSRQKS